jgi:ribosome recycling factor
MATNALRTTEDKMRKTVDGLKAELATIRTGRATPALIEHVKVDYEGIMMPINQLAGISVAEAKLLVIQPWDKSTMKFIEKAIMASDLGLTPVNDGNIIRISIPPLSEERRQELIKSVHRRVEERKIAIRNLRRDGLEELKALEGDKEISQDEHKAAAAQLQKITDTYIAGTDQLGKDKETELRRV